MTASLRALVERWRAKAVQAERYAHYQTARDLRACADDLAAQLPTLGEEVTR